VGLVVRNQYRGSSHALYLLLDEPAPATAVSANIATEYTSVGRQRNQLKPVRAKLTDNPDKAVEIDRLGDERIAAEVIAADDVLFLL
jgi:hypothetical protein